MAQMTLKTFSVGFIGYSVLSYLGFLFTSAGWPTVFWLYWGGGYFLVLIALVLIAHIVSVVLKIEPSVRFPKPLLGALFLSQILLILFNPGDCSDAEVKGWDEHVHIRFLERAMTGFVDFCQVPINQTEVTNILFHSPFATIMTGVALLYFPYLLIFVVVYVWSVWQSREKKSLSISQ